MSRWQEEARWYRLRAPLARRAARARRRAAFRARMWRWFR